MTGVRGLAHANIRASEAMIERPRRFHIDVVGLHEGPRPAFPSGSRGHWLYAGQTDVLHLTIAGPGEAPPAPTGHLNHLAFACTDLAAARARLDAAGLTYEVDEVDEPAHTALPYRSVRSERRTQLPPLNL